MGVSLSSPFAKCSVGLYSIIAKSINFVNHQFKTPSSLPSVNFKNEDLQEEEEEATTILKSIGPGNMTIDARCVSFKRKDKEDLTMSRISEKKRKEMMDDQSLESKCQMESPKHMAAVKLQKVYKSFRTRRKLADCAILIEQRWWKLLDFAELKHSSVSFFDIQKHETAISRWSRARTRAAKVGKGLSKDVKAKKLALVHWLEAIDPRHRYGHNLHFYYDKWLKSQSREPFFYWLDIGEGKEVNLDKCPRAKLQQQCVKYLGPMDRLPYEVVVEDGKFLYKQSGELLDTSSGENSRAKWIFVLSTSKTLYVGKKKKGSFQHSSFLAGGATSCAGRLVVEHGVLKAVWPHSGHYRPTEENFTEFISFLQENNVDLSNVKMVHVEEDSTGNTSGLEDEETNVEDSKSDEANLMETESESAPNKTRTFHNFGRELTRLEIPKRGQVLGDAAEQDSESFQMDSPTSDQETEQAFASELDHTISDEKQDESQEGTIPRVSILKRNMSQKGMKSYQLGKQLSSKWTTGAGPRIGCVRNHPCELQFRVLEQVNLSPRATIGQE